MEAYEEGEDKIKEILKKANEEKDDWTKAITIFNDRFLVPFQIIVSNRTDVILKEQPPVIGFEFKELHEKQEIKREDLLEVLSQGEKRALYLLDIIFEIEARKKEKGVHLFIIDDIADSFDYKNKYAIIEYLKDISEVNNFFQIILSHNYDFHRTISSRLSMIRKNKLTVEKSNVEITLTEEKYQNPVFNNWRDNLDDKYKFIASIALVRNLAEYSGNEEVFEKLTSCLHIKDDTKTLTINDIKKQFCEILKSGSGKTQKDGNFLTFLNDAANKIPDKVELEHKIVLAISIRLKTEQFIIKKIDNPKFVNAITKNQTQKLLDEFKKMFPDDTNSIKILNQVQLMTPESIHINSFMFEPLLDMFHEYLTTLHEEVKKLK